MNTNNVMKAIAELDLEPVKTKLMHVSGEGWSRATVDALDVEYRRFLYLMYAFPDEQAAPSVAVDTFWHYHILDTAKYAADCDSTFGRFMHHYPDLGLESAPEAGAEERGGNRMRELYERTFGVAYGVAEAAIDAQAAYCCYRPTEPVRPAAATQAAYCCYTPTGPVRPAVASQAAYCCYRSTETERPAAAANQAAYCCYRSTEPVRPAVASQAAYCCYRSTEPVRPAIAANQAAYCCYRSTEPVHAVAAASQVAYCCYRAPRQAAVQAA